MAELTGLLAVPAGYPEGMRIIVRRQRPQPGAHLDAFEERDGYRYTARSRAACGAQRGSAGPVVPVVTSLRAPGWA